MDNDNFHIIFPIVTKVYAKTLGIELISEEPCTTEEIQARRQKQILESRKKKIEKIKKNIKIKKRGLTPFLYLFSKSDNRCSIPAIINNISSL